MESGEHFVIQKGKAQCDKGSKFPNFKVSSHQHHYWNDGNGNAEHLAVTEDDVNFNPPAAPFGNCKLKNNNPCSFSPSGKWTKTYDKTKVLDKCCVIESSELMCATGGKITVMKHGQTASISKQSAEQADQDIIEELDPLTDINELLEDDDYFIS